MYLRVKIETKPFELTPDFVRCYKHLKKSGMIDVTFYQFISADNNLTMQFHPAFLHFSESG